MGTLYVVATPIGNLNDISKRALDTLTEVDLVACEDTRQSIKLLNHYDIKNKLISYHKFNEKDKSVSIVDDLINGKNVALISDAGTPCISDPGYNLVKLARDNGIEVIGIPGCSATVTALSVSGLSTSSYSFLGFLSNDTSKFNKELDLMHKSLINTFIIYESPKRLVKLVKTLKDEFPHSMIYIASDLTKIHERGFYGDIDTVYNTIKEDPNIEKGEYVIILEKHEEEVLSHEEEISIEALLVDTMIKKGISLKDAINYLNDNNKELKKNDIYKASLNLKDLL
jgi:16S rRNA (cytidine1402-2'-O)-methyltransferase